MNIKRGDAVIIVWDEVPEGRKYIGTMSFVDEISNSGDYHLIKPGRWYKRNEIRKISGLFLKMLV